MLANDRYFLFTIVPVLQATALGLLAWWAAFLLIGRFGWSPTFEYATAITFGYSLFLLLLEWPGRRWRIYQAFDDWILSLDYVYGKRKDLEARLDQFSARFVDCVHQSTADEIVLVGHSLGAIFAVDVLARALDADDRVRRSRVAVSLVTVGATIPKCALHPAADRLRAQINRIVNEPLIFWVEYQSRADAISFYRFHPVKLRRIKQNEDLLHARPVIRRLQIKDMLKAETFKKMRFKVLRLHYQFVSANDRRAPYDYFMMICVPVLSIKWAAARLGILEFFSDSDSAGVAEAPDSAS
jgi:pimeloyl-ACP methyl ester carboxylesterase